MIRQWSESCYAVYTGDDHYGGRLVTTCKSRAEAEAVVAQRIGGGMCDNGVAGGTWIAAGQPAHQERSQRSTGGLGPKRSGARL